MKNAIASRKAIRAIRKSAVSVAWSWRKTITAEIAATISMPRTNGLTRLTPLKVAASHDDQRRAARPADVAGRVLRGHAEAVRPGHARRRREVEVVGLSVRRSERRPAALGQHAAAGIDGDPVARPAAVVGDAVDE